jgi:ATP-binding cassette subfamily F protein 3
VPSARTDSLPTACAPAPVRPAVPSPAAPAGQAATAPGNGKREDRKAAAAARQKLADQTKPLKAELARLERRMAEAIALRDRLTEALAQPGQSAADRAEQGRQLHQAGDALLALETRWLELGTQIESMAIR